MADLISPRVSEYLESLIPDRHPELVRMEAVAREEKFPIIGPAAGQMCYVMARASGARHIFEMGSGFGYSTAWFARAVLENGGGSVHHVVWDDNLSQRASAHLTAMGLDQVVRYAIGEAVETLRASEGPYDLVFNDIDKEGYPGSLPVIEEKLRPGGILIIDNMLWSGRIFDDDDTSATTEGVREFTRRLIGSGRWDATLVPIRDGLFVARKRE